MKIHALAQAQDAMTAKRVYGEPFEKDGVTVIPAAAIRGGGGGEGGGVGYGIVARPVGAFIIKDGEVSWKPAVDATRVALRGLLIPIIGLLVFRFVVLAIARRR